MKHVALFLLMFTGCAGQQLYSEPAPGCPRARTVMAKHGTVIECWHSVYEDTLEPIDRCRILIHDERDAVVRPVLAPHCGL